MPERVANGAASSPGAEGGVAPRERLLPLEGGRNARDLGGYATADGRRVRWGLLFRSGSPAFLTEGDWARLGGLGLRGLCDLRTTEERLAAPFPFADAAGFDYWSHDCGSCFGELRALMTAPYADGPAAREAMLAGYRRLPFEQAPAFREIFRRLAAGEVPLMFNCSAGKDRAGTAAALVLAALGVPRVTVLEDYALSNHYLERDKLVADRGGGASLLGRQPPEVAQAILLCDPAYLAAAFEAIDARHGSLAAYFADALDSDAAALAGMCARLTEQAAP